MRKLARWLMALAKLAVVFGMASLNLVGWSQQGQQIHTVCRQGCAFDSIQAAVDAAQPDDRITIKGGVYRESLTLTKALTLEAERTPLAGQVLLINPAGSLRPTILVCGAAGITLSGLRVTHTDALFGSAVAALPGEAGTVTALRLEGVHLFGASSGGLSLGPSFFAESCSVPDERGWIEVWLQDALLSGNGAGVLIHEGLADGTSLTVQDTTIVDNGRGIGSASNDARLDILTLRNSLVAANMDGGLVGLQTGELTVEDSVFLRNGPQPSGTALEVNARHALLRGNSVSENHSGGVLIDALTRSTILLYNRIIGNAGCGLSFEANSAVEAHGRGNTIEGNQQPLCPAGVPLPQDFLLNMAHLVPGQTTTLPQRLALTFESVAADSRCPVDVVCFWEGDAEVVLTASLPGQPPQTLHLHTTLSPQEAVYHGVVIRFEDLAPRPLTDQRPIPPHRYRLVLSVRDVQEKESD